MQAKNQRKTKCNLSDDISTSVEERGRQEEECNNVMHNRTPSIGHLMVSQCKGVTTGSVAVGSSQIFARLPKKHTNGRF